MEADGGGRERTPRTVSSTTLMAEAEESPKRAARLRARVEVRPVVVLAKKARQQDRLGDERKRDAQLGKGAVDGGTGAAGHGVRDPARRAAGASRGGVGHVGRVRIRRRPVVRVRAAGPAGRVRFVAATASLADHGGVPGGGGSGLLSGAGDEGEEGGRRQGVDEHLHSCLLESLSAVT